jgi:hypothetical protein
LLSLLPRYISLLTHEEEESAAAAKEEDSVDLRTLRAIRVLRPLKLVSGVPSKFSSPDMPAPAPPHPYPHPPPPILISPHTHCYVLPKSLILHRTEVYM